VKKSKPKVLIASRKYSLILKNPLQIDCSGFQIAAYGSIPKAANDTDIFSDFPASNNLRGTLEKIDLQQRRKAVTEILIRLP
jgi:hypothetical protein